MSIDLIKNFEEVFQKKQSLRVPNVIPNFWSRKNDKQLITIRGRQNLYHYIRGCRLIKFYSFLYGFLYSMINYLIDCLAAWLSQGSHNKVSLQRCQNMNDVAARVIACLGHGWQMKLASAKEYIIENK